MIAFTEEELKLLEKLKSYEPVKISMQTLAKLKAKIQIEEDCIKNDLKHKDFSINN